MIKITIIINISYDNNNCIIININKLFFIYI